MKSAKNKTIDISVEDGRAYLERCARISGAAELSQITDRTICGDTFHVMPLLPPSFADLMIADPPYNLEKNFNGSTFRAVSESEYESYTESWLALAEPLLKPDAAVYVCCDWRCSAVVQKALGRRFIVRNRITWQREKGRGALRNWKNSMEDIWFATRSDTYTFNADAVKLRRRVMAPYRADGRPKGWRETADGNFRDTFPSNFWDDISVPYWSMAENTAHPTQKPEKLLARLILASSAAGAFVFDPFLGSGSTSVAAKKLGRHYCGVEQNEQYCVWAEKRLDDARRGGAIQGYTDGVFWERNTVREQALRGKAPPPQA